MSLKEYLVRRVMEPDSRSTRCCGSTRLEGINLSAREGTPASA